MISMIVTSMRSTNLPFLRTFSIPQVVTQISCCCWIEGGIRDRWAGHEFPYDSDCTGRFISASILPPPLKLKRNGWLGNMVPATLLCLGGQVMFGDLNWKIAILTLIYSVAGLNCCGE